jgi:acyl transferase domain-containing protein
MSPIEGRAQPIAIVGMGARFPGARNVHAFWDNLINARETVATLDEATLRQNEIDYDALKDDPDYVPRAGILDDVELWDNAFFRSNARQAALMDPQHRIWLECAWEALEDGCLDPARFGGNVGVYLGIGTRGNYLMANIVPDRAYLETFVRNGDVDVYETQLVNDRDYIATRTAYVFGLRGPAMTVQCACSTSLAAVAQACHSIWSGESDAALAGGASIQLPQARGYRYSPGGMFSRDGSTRSFDADASGTVFTCGVGAVLLQRLEDAVADRRPIYAVIRGAAVNNDGGVTQSYVAPHEDGQARVVELAQRMAGIDARSVSYIEAHGTATPVGDPIEVRALSRAFRQHTAERYRADRGFCGIGSVKSNIGHTSAAAGVAGLIKTTLALHHRRLPATLHFKRPNPQIDFADSPFEVIDTTRPWESDGPRRAGVSAFGVGGGNAHIVLEEVNP